MKKRLMTTVALSAIIGSLLLFAPGCSKKNVIPPDSATSGDAKSGRDINYPLAEGGYSEDNLPRDGNLDDNRPGVGSEFAADQQSDEYKRLHGRCSANLSPVYFDFDQSGIRPDMAQVMAENADYLKTIPGKMVIIEGNSDERGTNEYNMALGERRAINALQYLANIGIDSNRMRTLSYGEEKPLFMGQDEETYSLNRRVDFIVK
jgi:peptidoglycan-associated lipoprotein